MYPVTLPGAVGYISWPIAVRGASISTMLIVAVALAPIDMAGDFIWNSSPFLGFTPLIVFTTGPYLRATSPPRLRSKYVSVDFPMVVVRVPEADVPGSNF